MNSLRDLTFPFHASKLLADATLPDKAARERRCEYLCWCIACPKGLMMEPEKRSKIGLLREAKSQTTGVSSSRASFYRFAAGGSLQGLEHSRRRLKDAPDGSPARGALPSPGQRAAWKALKATTTPEDLAAYRDMNIRDDG